MDKIPEGGERIEFAMHRKPVTPEFRGSRNHLCLISNLNVKESIELLKEEILK